jgi:hypothetical protein
MAFGLPEMTTWHIDDWSRAVSMFTKKQFSTGDKVITPEGEEGRFCQENEGVAEVHLYHSGWDKPDKVFYPVNKLRKGE